MRNRVPVAMRNRVRKLERREKRELPVGGWPPIMDVDDWEALASRMQDALVSASRGATYPNLRHLPFRPATGAQGR